MLSDSQINMIFAFSNASIYEDHFYIVKFDERCNYDTKRSKIKEGLFWRFYVNYSSFPAYFLYNFVN